MTIEEAVLATLRALPPEKQQELLNFAEVLMQNVQAERQSTAVDWQNDPAIGMWSDRDDMQDSTAWVRQLRKRNRYDDALRSS